jgi:hypothetical protein
VHQWEHRHFPVTFTRRSKKKQRETVHSKSIIIRERKTGSIQPLGLFAPADGRHCHFRKTGTKDYSRGLFRQMDDRPAQCGIPACTTTIYRHGKPLGSHAVSGLAAIRHHISGFIYFFLMKMDG